MPGREVVIVGTGGLGRETLWAFENGEVRVRGFLTNESKEHGDEVCGLPVLGDESWAVDHRRDVEVVCAIGNPRARRHVVETMAAEGVRFAGAVHPSALLSGFVELGTGVIIGARAVLTTQVSVAGHCVLGVGAVVSHDSVLEAHATLAPGVVLAGHSQVGLAAELGAGATMIPRRRVGRGAVIGGQAVVVKDIPANAVAVGVPARVIRGLPQSLWI